MRGEGCAKTDRCGCALRVSGLACRYAAAEVFAEASFSLDQGSISFLVGPNGAGKSTLFRCLAGWTRPYAGAVELFGEPFDGSSREQRREIAYVPDVPSFYDDLTAQEHIRFVQQANGDLSADGLADDLMDAFGLSAHRDRYPSAYSRGMRQKLALVIALAAMPRLLLLDEPYGPLDPGAAEVLSSLLDGAHSSGAAVLVSCHHDVPNLMPDQLLRLADGSLEVIESDGFADGLPFAEPVSAPLVTAPGTPDASDGVYTRRG
ncbi:ABC transporter ATP-binding protein [Raoultibacter timonensis]|uniref:ABC transporter ATP-binding protein n=1 Tax=Raoultibacter timonensis TaxID=1907662 RepID=UPI000C85BB1B|nr:ABC transporter ATP-binding protein [Raoultibacter timonensis]